MVVGEGQHDFDVRARDIFWNVGPEASATFRLDLDGPAGDDDGEGGCECAAVPVGAGGPAAALVVALLAGQVLRRRATRA